MTILFEATIPGRVPVKKNTARHFGRAVVYSKAYRIWAVEASQLIRNVGINEPISEYFQADFVFYLKNKQWEPDVSNVCEGPQDILESCNIILNDRLIKHLNAKKVFDPVNPRLEIVLRSL